MLTVVTATGNNVTYTWDFGDGMIGYGQIATHTFDQVGEQAVTVTATNLVSTAVAPTKVLIFESGYVIYLPLVSR